MPGKKPTARSQAADRKRAPTIVDVARLAGVSPATASRAFNGSDRQVKETNLDRVLAAARQLDYVPNASAQTVRRGDTTTVALLISDITDGVMEQAKAWQTRPLEAFYPVVFLDALFVKMRHERFERPLELPFTLHQNKLSAFASPIRASFRPRSN